MLPEGADNRSSGGFLHPTGGFCFWGDDPIATEDFKRKHTVTFSANVKADDCCPHIQQIDFQAVRFISFQGVLCGIQALCMYPSFF